MRCEVCILGSCMQENKYITAILLPWATERRIYASIFPVTFCVFVSSWLFRYYDFSSEVTRLLAGGSIGPEAVNLRR